MKIGTLFSGIGAPEFAMESANIKHTIAYACDNDPHVKRTYLANHRPEIWYDDVTDITNPPEVDLLMFGFPCQPFSLAGHRNGLKDARGRLVWSAIKMLGKSRPKMIIAENVEGLVRHDNGRTLPIILKSMRGYGYHVQWQLLNSLHFGLPRRAGARSTRALRPRHSAHRRHRRCFRTPAGSRLCLLPARSPDRRSRMAEFGLHGTHRLGMVIIGAGPSASPSASRLAVADLTGEHGRQ